MPMLSSHNSIKMLVDFAIHALKFGGGFCFLLADPTQHHKCGPATRHWLVCGISGHVI
jgi:hypothetical protein